MQNTVARSVKEKLGFQFNFLPDFAAYLLRHSLEHFVDDLLCAYEAIDIPLLRFFKSMAPEERRALITGASREMLTLIAANNIEKYIDQSIRNWITNQLPMVTRDQIHSEDITLVAYSRARILRKFAANYTRDTEVLLKLVDEIDRFTVMLTSEAFATYIQLQQEEINKINNALKKREQQLLEAQEIGHIGSFEWDFSGKQSSYTPQMFKIFEMEGPSNLESFLDDVHPDDKERVSIAIKKALTEGVYECEYRYVRNNKEKLILSHGRVQFENGVPARMIGTVTDVTERHQIIEKLQQSEKLHNQAQALTHIGNWSWHMADNRVTWSDEMYRIYGLEPQSEEISLERFFSFVHPDDRTRRKAEIEKALETLKVDEYHFKIVAANGATKILRGKGEVVADATGKPFAMLGTCQDITQEFSLTQQLRERERYLEELNKSLEFANTELSRTNEELESFNFIASHDLQEPLRKIQVYSNRILENGFGKLPEPLQDYFGRINAASRRMQNLIEDFLVFSQTFDNTQSVEQIDLHALLDEIRSELVTRIEDKQAEIKVEKLPVVTAIRFQIKQLLTNLITNALKYTRSDVVPRIIITGCVVTGKQTGIQDANPRMSYAKISVQDNGIGFDPKYRFKIFELFQRLHSKNVYSGTGIGLALCKKIVRNMGGFITADSEPEKGAVFTFYIPEKR